MKTVVLFTIFLSVTVCTTSGTPVPEQSIARGMHYQKRSIADYEAKVKKNILRHLEHLASLKKKYSIEEAKQKLKEITNSMVKHVEATETHALSEQTLKTITKEVIGTDEVQSLFNQIVDSDSNKEDLKKTIAHYEAEVKKNILQHLQHLARLKKKYSIIEAQNKLQEITNTMVKHVEATETHALSEQTLKTITNEIIGTDEVQSLFNQIVDSDSNKEDLKKSIADYEAEVKKNILRHLEHLARLRTKYSINEAENKLQEITSKTIEDVQAKDTNPLSRETLKIITKEILISKEVQSAFKRIVLCDNNRVSNIKQY